MALTKITPQMFDTSAAGHDFNIDNGTFVVDASANRVGIGTATPSTLLDVNGTATATTFVGALTGNVTGNVSGTAATVTGAAQTNITSVGTLSGLTVTNPIAGSVTGTAATVTGAAQTNITSLGTLTGLTTSGSVGFRVAADSNYAFVAMQNGSLTHGGYMSIQGGTATGLEINASASSSFSGTVLLAKQSQRTSGGYLARFANSAGDKVTIATDGTATFSGNVTADKYIMVGGSQIGQDYAYIKSNSTSSASLTLRKDSTGADSIDFLQLRSDANGLIGKIEGDGDISFKDATFSGNVNAGAGLRLYTDGSNNAVLSALGQNKSMYFAGDDAGVGINALILDMANGGNATFSGNVGIGVTPGSWSSNYGAIQLGQGATFTGHKSNTQTQLGQNWWIGTGNQYVVNGAASRLVMNADSSIIFSQAPSGTASATMSTIYNRLIIDTSGRVGINQTPGANNFTLQVTGRVTDGSDGRVGYFKGHGTQTSIGSTGPTIALQNANNTVNNYTKLSFESANSGETVSINAQTTDHTNHYGDMAFNTRGSSGYSEKMRITSNGYVGIGGTPTNPLQVFGGASDSRIQFTNNATGNAYSDGLWVGIDSTQGYILHRENTNLTFFTNASKRMTLDTNGNLAVSTHANAPAITHKSNTSITATQAAAGTWSHVSGESGTYTSRGAIEVAGIYNRHFYKWGFSGNLSASTFYPFTTRTDLTAAANQTGSGSEDGFGMYFRVYTYLSSSGYGEYAASRVSNMIWISHFGSNSNQVHYFNLGPGFGHAPNAGDSAYGNAAPFILRVQHRYGSDSTFSANQTFEISCNAALTGLNAGTAGRQLLIYGYLL